jgi:hypothetical protein
MRKIAWHYVNGSVQCTATVLLTLFFVNVVHAQWTTGTNINNTNSGNVNIGSTAPTEKLTVTNSNPDALGIYRDLDVNSVGAAGTLIKLGARNGTAFTTGAQITGVLDNPASEGYLTLSTRSSSTLYERLRISASGNVGIGTTSPFWKLSVNDATVAYNSDAGNIVVTNSSDTTKRLLFGYDTSLGTNGSSFIQSVKSGTGTTPLLLQPNGGNVGIGMTDPSTPLTTAGWSNSGMVIGNGSTTAGLVLFSSPTSAFSSLRFASGSSGLHDQGFVLYNHSSNFMSFGTNRGTRLTIDAGGNVGIGTTSPAYALSVSSATPGLSRVSVSPQTGTDYALFQAANNGGTFYIGLENSAGSGFGAPAYGAVLYNGANTPMQFYTNGGERLRILANGYVGIGEPNPTNRLQVAGNGRFTGNLTVDGNIAAKYQDVAEWVPSSEQLTAGTVVVLDATKSNQVISSSVAYDTRVAGVISAQPGITLGEKSEGRVLVATTGRVKVKVDATKAPIHIGDLLVTSDVPGVAMKSEAVNLGGVQFHRPGTLIGKALEPLERGKGEILVLLSLQ